MIAHATAWLRFAILELLARNPEGATLGQLAITLAAYDPEHRVGRIFQVLREAGDIQESDTRSAYTLSERGRQWLDAVQGMTLEKHVTLTERAPAKTLATRPTQEKRNAFWQPKAPPPRIGNMKCAPMRLTTLDGTQTFDDTQPLDSRKTTPAGKLQMNILRVLRATTAPMSPADIFAALKDNSSRIKVKYHIHSLERAGQIVGAGKTAKRRYAHIGKAELLAGMEIVPVAKLNHYGDSPQAKAKRERIVQILVDAGRPLSFQEVRHAIEWRKNTKLLRLHIRRLVNSGDIAAAGNTVCRRYAALEHAGQLATAPGASIGAIPAQDKSPVVTDPPRQKFVDAATGNRIPPNHQLVVFAIENAITSLMFLKETLLEVQR